MPYIILCLEKKKKSTFFALVIVRLLEHFWKENHEIYWPYIGQYLKFSSESAAFVQNFHVLPNEGQKTWLLFCHSSNKNERSFSPTYAEHNDDTLTANQSSKFNFSRLMNTSTFNAENVFAPVDFVEAQLLHDFSANRLSIYLLFWFCNHYTYKLFYLFHTPLAACLY